MEEILLKKFRNATSITYFNTKYVPEDVNLTPSFVILDNFNNPVSVHSFDGVSLWSRNENNDFISLSSVTTNYVTGQTFFAKSDYELKEYEKEKIKERFAAKMEKLFKGESVTYVFFKNESLEDLHATISLKRTYESLDTLSVYNTVVNDIPSQEATTGVVFGKLEAVQKITNRQGQKVRIPLRNVPIGIFSPSDKYPTTTTVDENGDRIILNFKETLNDESFYFNDQSYKLDQNVYLRSLERVDEMPSHYQYITKTNDEGEFVLYDIPIGTQTLIFEVDILSQGLTKDEVALNRFPYPGSVLSNIDSIPHFFFQQIPIDVVPAWGTNQTGYTEINVGVNLDLRKWTTYFVCPVDHMDMNITQLVVEDYQSPLKVFVRDMSLENFPDENIPIVEIHDMLNRVGDQTLEWRNEFAQVKNAAEFRTHDFHAIKLPANMYDPDGYSSVEYNKKLGLNQKYKAKKGVWLSGYQLKMQFIDDSIYRCTGGDFQTAVDGSIIFRSHYDVNWGYLQPGISNQNEKRSINFPYEKSWDHTYPEPYKIPRKPIERNANKTVNPDGTWVAPNNLEQPKYTDGDLIGSVPRGFLAGGYGLQVYNPSDGGTVLFENRFSKRLTRDFIYRYEDRGSWYEEYSNGFRPYAESDIYYGQSKVLNGEKYQRVEAGYGYWLRPEGWPRCKHVNENHDRIDEFDLEKKNANNEVSVIERDITLTMGHEQPKKEGMLDIYRIIDPSPSNLVKPEPIPTPTSIVINFNRIYRKRRKDSGGGGHLLLKYPHWGNIGDNDDQVFRYGHSGNGNWFFNTFKLKVFNLGEIKVVSPFTGQEIMPGSFDEKIYSSGAWEDGPELTLDGNADFSILESKYTTARYRVEFHGYGNGSGTAESIDGDLTVFDLRRNDGSALTASENPISYYLFSDYNNCRSRLKKKINGNWDCKNGGRMSTDNLNVRIKGIVLAGDVNNNTYWAGSYWESHNNIGAWGGHVCGEASTDNFTSVEVSSR